MLGEKKKKIPNHSLELGSWPATLLENRKQRVDLKEVQFSFSTISKPKETFQRLTTNSDSGAAIKAVPIDFLATGGSRDLKHNTDTITNRKVILYCRSYSYCVNEQLQNI